MKKAIHTMLIAAVLLCAAAYSFAQGLAVGTAKPVVDGVIDAAQYAYKQDFGQMTLYFQRSADMLYIGAVGKTTGWVAVGLGSKMNAAPIYIGYFAGGKGQFMTEVGAGHAHQEAAEEAIVHSVSSWAVKEQGGVTTLEIALKSVVAPGQKELTVIYSIGPGDNFTAYHSFRGAMVVPLK